METGNRNITQYQESIATMTETTKIEPGTRRGQTSPSSCAAWAFFPNRGPPPIIIQPLSPRRFPFVYI
jgi:hypothetical protein